MRAMVGWVLSVLDTQVRMRWKRLIVLLLVLTAAIAAAWMRGRPRAGKPGGSADPRLAAISDSDALGYVKLESQEKAAEESDWRKEMEAERYEDVINALWDELNHSDQALGVIARLPVPSLIADTKGASRMLPHGITEVRSTSGATEAVDLRRVCSEAEAAGWKLARSSWHVLDFQPEKGGRGAVCEVEAEGRLLRREPLERAVVRAHLRVEWKPATANSPTLEMAEVRASEWSIRRRVGAEGFVADPDIALPNSRRLGFVDPLLAADLDGDGRSEFVLPGANLVIRNRGGALMAEPMGLVTAGAVMAGLLLDLTGDGLPDLLLAGGEGLYLFENDGNGRFSTSGKLLWRAPEPLKHAQTLTAGDVDGDGKIDLWLGQYKLPYQGGQFPTPYFDAQDGFPSYFLRNVGDLRFEDMSSSWGRDVKRFRRNYSTSLVDLNGDGRSDLVSVSDFAGMDLYLNDGGGRWRDAAGGLGRDRHLFGMAHAIADFDEDGRPDVLAIGMTSTLATRLDRMGLGRTNFREFSERRSAMTFGNRLFLGSGEGFRQAPFAVDLARSGWSWGVSAADVDNDGRIDIAIATGHETHTSVRDYERQFWLHDMYVGGSTNNSVAALYFGAANARRARDSASYGGWQDNVLFMNLGGGRFMDLAFLLGAAVPEDTQNLIADDLDGDGRLDLAMVSFGPWPERAQHLRVLRNRLDVPGHWIGLRLDATGPSWVGARVEVEAEGRVQRRWLVSGDSFRSQHAAAVHFGLGAATRIQRLEVISADGRRTRVEHPKLDAWQALR